MPNWCNNNITISGPAETIRQLWDTAQTADEGKFGLLEAMAPIGDWEYESAVNAWGTKWDISDEGLEIVEHGDGTAEITGWFDSAWAPPIGAYERFTEANEDCEITASYYECGMDFAGFWHGMEEHLDDLHAEYKLPEDERSDLYNRLDEEWGLSEQFADYDEDEEMLEDE
jgi:hypothetical protein